MNHADDLPIQDEFTALAKRLLEILPHRDDDEAEAILADALRQVSRKRPAPSASEAPYRPEDEPVKVMRAPFEPNRALIREALDRFSTPRASEARRIEVQPTRLGYRIHLRDVWGDAAHVNTEEAHALFEGLGEQLGREFGAQSATPTGSEGA